MKYGPKVSWFPWESTKDLLNPIVPPSALEGIINWSPVPSVVSTLFLFKNHVVVTSDKLYPLGSVIDSSPVTVSPTEYLPSINDCVITGLSP